MVTDFDAYPEWNPFIGRISGELFPCMFAGTYWKTRVPAREMRRRATHIRQLEMDESGVARCAYLATPPQQSGRPTV
jgi:hypothetical protein